MNLDGMDRQFKIRAERVAWADKIDVIIGIPGNPSATTVDIAKLNLVPMEIGHKVMPTMELSFQEAQELMDELWRCGLRPTEGTGSAGALAAVEKHLNDMRQIAFDLLNSRPHDGG